MKPAWRLVLHIALWAAMFPAIGVGASILERTIYPSITTDPLPVPMVWAALIAWAVWIYWRCVPRAPGAVRRVAYLLSFAGVMAVVGYLALHAAIVIVIMLFGL